MGAILPIAGVVILAANLWLLMICWRHQTVLGGVCAVAATTVALAVLGTRLTGEAGEDALIAAVVALLIGIVLLGLGQTLKRLLDETPKESV